MTSNALARSAGVTVPLFSLRRRGDWGIGTIGAVGPFAAFVAKHGFSLVQILPPHELPAGESSPYGARTAFALDPIYLDIDAVPELTPALVEEALGKDGRDALTYLRRAERVDYTTVRACKERALTAAFDAFDQAPAARREAFARFREAERAWLEDHTLYIASAALHRNADWRTWLGKLRDREPEALAKLAVEQRGAVDRAAYEQFLLFEAWDAMRAELARLRVKLMGDLPFIVGHASVDAWSRPTEFNRDRSLGAPPDGFSPEGQDWGLPSFDWAAMDATGLAWVRTRARHSARLYDCFRVDHVIGIFRQWTKGAGEKTGSFTPKTAPEQIARGRKVLSAMVEEAGAGRVIAEDLGVIPDWARHTLRALRIPGYKVLPWEKDGRGFLREPKAFDALSVATWSTHDTAPITQWWDDFTAHVPARLPTRNRVEQVDPVGDATEELQGRDVEAALKESAPPRARERRGGERAALGFQAPMAVPLYEDERHEDRVDGSRDSRGARSRRPARARAEREEVPVRHEPAVQEAPVQARVQGERRGGERDPRNGTRNGAKGRERQDEDEVELHLDRERPVDRLDRGHAQELLQVERVRADHGERRRLRALEADVQKPPREQDRDRERDPVARVEAHLPA